MNKMIPALSGFFILSTENIENERRHWRKECPIFIPELLVSYGTCFSLKRFLQPKIFRFEKYNEIFLDSGGFQIAERGLNINCNEVIKWQMNFVDLLDDNKSVVFPLDYPLAGKGAECPTADEVERRAQKTYQNTIKLIDSVKGRNTKIYAIFQFSMKRNYKEIWWNEAVKPLLKDVDGIAMAVRPMTRMHEYLPFALSLLYEQGVENVHCFVGTGRRAISIFPLFEDKFKVLTFDSTTFTLDASKGKLFTPFLDRIRIGNKGMKSNLNFKDIKCFCPVCKRFYDTDISNLSNISSANRYIDIGLHNLYHIIQYLNHCIMLKRNNYDKYVSYVSRNIGMSQDILFDIIDNGFQKSYRKYYGGNLGEWI